MVKGQIGILISAVAIIAFAVALWRQHALGTLPLIIVVICAVGISGFLVMNF